MASLDTGSASAADFTPDGGAAMSADLGGGRPTSVEHSKKTSVGVGRPLTPFQMGDDNRTRWQTMCDYAVFDAMYDDTCAHCKYPFDPIDRCWLPYIHPPRLVLWWLCPTCHRAIQKLSSEQGEVYMRINCSHLEHYAQGSFPRVGPPSWFTPDALEWWGYRGPNPTPTTEEAVAAAITSMKAVIYEEPAWWKDLTNLQSEDPDEEPPVPTVRLHSQVEMYSLSKGQDSSSAEGDDWGESANVDTISNQSDNGSWSFVSDVDGANRGDGDADVTNRGDGGGGDERVVRARFCALALMVADGQHPTCECILQAANRGDGGGGGGGDDSDGRDNGDDADLWCGDDKKADDAGKVADDDARIYSMRGRAVYPPTCLIRPPSNN